MQHTVYIFENTPYIVSVNTVFEITIRIYSYTIVKNKQFDIVLVEM